MKRIVVCLALLLAAPATARAAGAVHVFYAGSLLNLMERDMGPAFEKKASDVFEGFAGGSKALANQIKGRLRHGDVFISASPSVNKSLMGPVNGDWIDWYVSFARSPLVIGYNPKSRFAEDLKTKPWIQVLQEPGIRIGRTDPKLDPKGALTVRLLNHAEKIYGSPGLAQKVLGSPENPDQVSPEETLVGRLQSGQIDLGFFYSTETSDLKIPSIPLPADVSLGAVYTAALLNHAPDAAAGASFLRFLFGAQGRSIMKDHGLTLTPLAVSGDASKVPASLRHAIGRSK